MSTEPRKGLDLPPMCNAGPDGPCDDEWCQGHAATPKTYYDAPEPDDLQRRCWIIDDGQCRLYNGHEGGHDFGGATSDRADLPGERHAVWRQRVDEALAAAGTDDPDAAALSEWLSATPDRADPYYTGRTTQDWHREPEPERRAEGLDDIRAAVQDATQAMSWALPVILAVRAWRDTPRHPAKKREYAALERAVLDAINDFDEYAALTPLPAEKAVLTANELEEGK